MLANLSPVLWNYNPAEDCDKRTTVFNQNLGVSDGNIKKLINCGFNPTCSACANSTVTDTITSTDTVTETVTSTETITNTPFTLPQASTVVVFPCSSSDIALGCAARSRSTFVPGGSNNLAEVVCGTGTIPCATAAGPCSALDTTRYNLSTVETFGGAGSCSYYTSITI